MALTRICGWRLEDGCLKHSAWSLRSAQMIGQREREKRERKTDRQRQRDTKTGRQTDRLAGRQTGRQAGRQAERQ